MTATCALRNSLVQWQGLQDRVIAAPLPRLSDSSGLRVRVTAAPFLGPVTADGLQDRVTAAPLPRLSDSSGLRDRVTAAPLPRLSDRVTPSEAEGPANPLPGVIAEVRRCSVTTISLLTRNHL